MPKEIGKDVASHMANPVIAHAGEARREPPADSPQALTVSLTPLVTIPGRMDRTLGPTQQVTSDAVTKPGTFPISSAKWRSSVEKFPSLKQACQMDILIYFCIMQAVRTRGKPGCGRIAH